MAQSTPPPGLMTALKGPAAFCSMTYDQKDSLYFCATIGLLRVTASLELLIHHSYDYTFFYWRFCGAPKKVRPGRVGALKCFKCTGQHLRIHSAPREKDFLHFLKQRTNPSSDKNQQAIQGYGPKISFCLPLIPKPTAQLRPLGILS